MVKNFFSEQQFFKLTEIIRLRVRDSNYSTFSDSAEFDDCAEKADADIRLSDTKVFWTYQEGDKRIREDVISAKNLRKYLSKLAKQSDEITYEKFYHFIVEANENFKDFDEGLHAHNIVLRKS